MDNEFRRPECENLRQRNEYLQSVDKLLETLKEKAVNNRRDTVTNTGKEELRKQFVDMLGYPLNRYGSSGNLNNVINIKTDPPIEHKDGDMIVTRYQLEVMPDFWFYGILYEAKENPESPADKNALVLALHGGGGDPEVIGDFDMPSGNYSQMVKRVVRKGIKVFAPQLLIWNHVHLKGPEYNRVDVDKKLKAFGGSITALEVYCMMRCIDYFSGLDNMDENRVGIVGLSYGGMYTMYTAAADTRIKVALSSCWFNDRSRYRGDGDTDWSYFNLANTFYDAEVGLLVLPRKLFVEIGGEDGHFEPQYAAEDIKRLEQYAKAENCEDSLRINVFKGGHELDKANDGIDFLLKNL